jgi:hypothetical protein
MEMRRLIVAIGIVFLSTSALAHEVQLITQYLKINRQNDTGLQTDLFAKATLSPKYEVGLQGTYLERFSYYEKRAGAFVIMRPSPSLTFEARYAKGDGDVEILPRDQYSLGVYHALSDGLSPFLSYQNVLYSITHVQSMRLGIEIEKFTNIIIIPQVMIGQAEFKDPAEVEEVNSLGLKVIYYREDLYSLLAYAYKGLEASQAIIGRSATTIETKTVGGGGAYYFIPGVKTELLFEYMDLGELDNQFITTTLNLAWAF